MCGMPCSEYVCVHEEPELLVSVHDWVFTKNQFIMLWFWLVTGTRAYSPSVNHMLWNTQLTQLNPEQVMQMPTWAQDKILENALKLHILPHFILYKPDQHKEIMQRILESHG